MAANEYDGDFCRGLVSCRRRARRASRRGPVKLKRTDGAPSRSAVLVGKNAPPPSARRGDAERFSNPPGEAVGPRRSRIRRGPSATRKAAHTRSPKSNGFKPFGSLRISDARRRSDRHLGAIARISRRERLADTCAAQSDGPLIRFPGDHFGLAILGHPWNPVRPLMVSG